MHYTSCERRSHPPMHVCTQDSTFVDRLRDIMMSKRALVFLWRKRREKDRKEYYISLKLFHIVQAKWINSP